MPHFAQTQCSVFDEQARQCTRQRNTALADGCSSHTAELRYAPCMLSRTSVGKGSGDKYRMMKKKGSWMKIMCQPCGLCILFGDNL